MFPLIFNFFYLQDDLDVYYDSEPEEDYYVTVAGDKRSASVKSVNTSNCALTFCLGN